MLQRIQSIYILLAVILNLTTLFVPVWQFTNQEQTELLNGISAYEPTAEDSAASFFDHPDGVKSAMHSLFFGLACIGSLYLLWLIFQYQDRKRQIKLSYIGIGILMVEILALVLLTQREPDFITAATASKPHFGFALPVLAIMSTFLAIRGIRKDEELVRSEDRIR
jgi:hypothetical protein